MKKKHVNVRMQETEKHISRKGCKWNIENEIIGKRINDKHINGKHISG